MTAFLTFTFILADLDTLEKNPTLEFWNGTEKHIKMLRLTLIQLERLYRAERKNYILM